jgi:hypothetical protein
MRDDTKPVSERSEDPAKPFTRDRRAISGNRVLCACSLDLPKVDPFYAMKTYREGHIILNVRGGSLYIPNQFTVVSIKHLFKPAEASTIRNFNLYPESSTEISLGNVDARFLNFTNGKLHVGMVLRFVNLTEKQLDTLNSLVSQLPAVSGSEELSIHAVISQTTQGRQLRA